MSTFSRDSTVLHKHPRFPIDDDDKQPPSHLSTFILSLAGFLLRMVRALRFFSRQYSEYSVYSSHNNSIRAGCDWLRAHPRYPARAIGIPGCGGVRNGTVLAFVQRYYMRNPIRNRMCHPAQSAVARAPFSHSHHRLSSSAGFNFFSSPTLLSCLSTLLVFYAFPTLFKSRV